MKRMEWNRHKHGELLIGMSEKEMICVSPYGSIGEVGLDDDPDLVIPSPSTESLSTFLRFVGAPVPFTVSSFE